jgi:transketolase
VDGHDVSAVQRVLSSVPAEEARPTVVIARTVKGKGISFSENTNVWHYGKLNADQRETALAEIGAVR